MLLVMFKQPPEWDVHWTIPDLFMYNMHFESKNTMVVICSDGVKYLKDGSCMESHGICQCQWADFCGYDDTSLLLCGWRPITSNLNVHKILRTVPLGMGKLPPIPWPVLGVHPFEMTGLMHVLKLKLFHWIFLLDMTWPNIEMCPSSPFGDWVELIP